MSAATDTADTAADLIARIANWKLIARQCMFAWKTQDKERAEAMVARLEAELHNL